MNFSKIAVFLLHPNMSVKCCQATIATCNIQRQGNIEIRTSHTYYVLRTYRERENMFGTFIILQHFPITTYQFIWKVYTDVTLNHISIFVNSKCTMDFTMYSEKVLFLS